MDFLSIDLETSGIDSENDQILEVGIVAVDTQTPPSTWKTFHTIIEHERVNGSPYAIALNSRIFDFLKRYNDDPEDCEEDYNVLTPADLYPEILAFLSASGYEMKNGHYTIAVAGKNAAGFDIPFLKNHFNRYSYTNFGMTNDVEGEQIRFRKRVIDPAVLFTDFIFDKELPNLEKCKERAGLPSIVTHNALEDAWDVVYLVCKHIGYDFEQLITDEMLDAMFPKQDSNLYTYWAVGPTLAIRKFINNEFSRKPNDLFHIYEIGDFLMDNWEYIWNMKNVISAAPTKYEA